MTKSMGKRIPGEELGFGLGLRAKHFDFVLENRPSISWFEIISENFMGMEGHSGGRPLHVLDKVRQHYPMVMHGVSLSIGSVDPLNLAYLTRLKELADRVQPLWMSDHLTWTGVENENFHDLLPMPYTHEALDHLVDRLDFVQNLLKRTFLIENVSSYVTFKHSEMTEWEFLNQLTKRSGCGLLLDVNNIYVSAFNHGFLAKEFVDAIPAESVYQIHLAGHTNNENHIIDSHDQDVCDPVWELYRYTIQKMGKIPTMIERDGNIPEFDALMTELQRAKQIWEEISHERDRENTQPGRNATLDALDHH